MTTRFPNGISNAARGSDLEDMGQLDPTAYHTYFNDFDEAPLATEWTLTAVSVGTGTSAITTPDTDGGMALITSAANENDGLWAQLKGETFLLESGKKTWMKARFNTSDAIQSDMVVGLHSTSTTPQAATMRFLFETVDG